MMREYKRYEEYQDSGVEWIGEIPEDWKVVKLKFITECLDNLRVPLNSTERAEMKGNIPYWGANSIVDYVNDWLVDEEVILLGEDGAPFFDKLKNVAFYSSEKIWPNNHVHVLRVNNQNEIKFLIYSLNITDYTEFITGSTRDKLNQSAMSEIPLQLPSQNEQQKIASFLDQKTAEIDEIISKKETLIDHLEKYKKSVITEAVTKGKLGDKYINEDGELVDEIEMKDSGVDWVGEIPEYWNIGKASYIFKKISSGTTPSSDNLDYYDGNIKWLMTGDLNDSYVYSTTKKITKKALIENSSLEIYPKDSLVIAMYGATIGKLGIIGDEMTTNQACCVLSDSTFNQVKYYYYWLLSKREALISLAQGGGQPNINQDLIKNFSLPISSNTISRLIINYLDKKTELIDTLIQKTKTSIQKYKEYKKSLIFEAVTGKIDLRDYELKGGE